MLRFFSLGLLVLFALLAILARVIGGPAWWVLAVLLVGLAGVAIYDVVRCRWSRRWGLSSFDDLEPRMLRRGIEHGHIASYAELTQWLTPSQLAEAAPADWQQDWELADPDRFRP